MSQMIAGYLVLALTLIGVMTVAFFVVALFGDYWDLALLPLWFWVGTKLFDTINFRSQKDSLHV